MKEDAEVFSQQKILMYDTSAKIIYNLLDFVVTLLILKQVRDWKYFKEACKYQSEELLGAIKKHLGNH